MTKRTAVFFLISSFSFLILFFQNCGDIALQSQNDSGSSLTPTLSLSPPQIQFCSSLSEVRPFNLRQVWLVNLTARINLNNGFYEADSDMDGLTDNLEESYSLSPSMRRTHGLLDGICSSFGGNGSGACTTSIGGNNFISTGLFDSDLAQLHLTQSGLGAVSAEDNVPDVLKVLIGINPSTLISTTDDTDLDGKTDFNELMVGRNPFVSLDQDLPISAEVRSYPEPDPSVACPSQQEGFRLVIQQLPLFFPLSPYTDDTGLESNLSHTSQENVFALYLVSSSADAGTQQSRLYEVLFKARPQSSTPSFIQPGTFRLVKEW